MTAAEPDQNDIPDQVVAIDLLVFRVPKKRLQADAHRGQWIVNFVSNAGCELAEFGEALFMGVLHIFRSIADRFHDQGLFHAVDVGFAYERKFFDTAEFAEDEGEDTGAVFGVVGMRIIY